MIHRKQLYGLIGKSLGHSFSAAFFEGFFEAEDIDAEYRNFPIDDVSLLPEIIHENPDLRGLNVTIPYKESVIPFLSKLSPEAAGAGAVNVVKIIRDDAAPLELVGYNTDITGFREACSPYISSGTGGALVLGTGGAAKAAKYALCEFFHRDVKTVSREQGRADYTYSDLTPEIISRHKIIVNATPLGMWPDTGTLPDIPYEGISLSHFCVDWVYNPVNTEFMKQCRRRGATVGSGLDILHLQAVASWEIWSGS